MHWHWRQRSQQLLEDMPTWGGAVEPGCMDTLAMSQPKRCTSAVGALGSLAGNLDTVCCPVRDSHAQHWPPQMGVPRIWAHAREWSCGWHVSRVGMSQACLHSLCLLTVKGLA